jgi:D-mannitol 1-phosphate 5-dehydrogenase (EC 1.1.1.17)
MILKMNKAVNCMKWRSMKTWNNWFKKSQESMIRKQSGISSKTWTVMPSKSL